MSGMILLGGVYGSRGGLGRVGVVIGAGLKEVRVSGSRWMCVAGSVVAASAVCGCGGGGALSAGDGAGVGGSLELSAFRSVEGGREGGGGGVR